MGDSVIQQEGRDSPMVLLRKLHNWRMAFFGLIILLAGMLTGSAITLVIVRRLPQPRAPQPDAVVARMIRQIGPRLGLSPEQRQQVDPILRRHMNRLDQIRERGREQIAEQLRLLNEDLSQVLTADQQRRWQRFMETLPGQFRGGFGPRPLAPGAEGRQPGGRRGPGPRNPAPTPPPGETPPQQN